MTCHNCQLKAVKAGRDRKGNQRYRCDKCKRRFQAEQEKLLGAYRKNQESQKTENQKPFDAIEKLVRGQMWAKIFSAKSFCLLFRQAPRQYVLARRKGFDGSANAR